MRARSCALHSDSPEEFLQMAEMTMNCSGLFYDDRVNRQIVGSITAQSSTSSRKSNLSHQVKEGNSQRENPWSQFDFGLEIQVDKQEREELERMKEFQMKQANIGIITSHPKKILTQLNSFLGLAPAKQEIERGLNLVTSCRDGTVYKYWIISKEFMNSEMLLVQVYLDHCCCIYDMDVVQDSGAVLENWRNWNIPALLI